MATYILCNPNQVDTWIHVLLWHIELDIKALSINKPNRVVYELQKLFLSHTST